MIIVMEHNATSEQLNRVIKYIEDRGLKTDFVILLKTFGAVCGLEGI